MNFSVISGIIILSVVMGFGETENSVKLDREKRMTNNVFNSFFNLIDSFGSNQNQGQNGGAYRPNGGNNNQNGGYNRPNSGNNRPNGGNNRPNGGNNRPNSGNVQQPCSPNNQCDRGYGDCETNQDCRWGLLCGKNNCRGEFGSHSPQGIPWERKDDCCTDNSNYCDPGDRLPSSRRTCCSPSNPCPFSHGDCDEDADCQSGLKCGDNNCKDFHTGAGNKDDCCTYRENGGNQPSGNGGFNRPNGGNNRPNNGIVRPNGGSQPNGGLQQCSPNNQCGLGYGDCETDQDCRRGLFCGKNNCKGEFGARAPDRSLWAEKDDCCTNNRHYCNQANLFPWWRRTCCGPSNPCPFKHGDCDKDHDCVSNLVCGDNNCRDFHSNAGNKDDCCTYPNYKKKRSVEGDEISSLPEDEVSKPFNETIDGEEDQVSKPFNETIDAEKDRSKRNKRFIFNKPSSSSGGYRPSNGGFSSSSGGYRPNNGGFSSNNGGYRPNNGGNRPNNGGYRPNNGGFSSSSGGFSSNNGGNRPNNGGYRPNNGGFSSNNGGNRPNNGGYRPSNGGFSSNNGGNRPNNGGFTNSNSRPTGGNRPLSGCEASPSFRCCTRERPCSLGGGDCTGDADCQGGLVCGSNNCRKFHPNADKKMDCCAFKKIK